MQSSERDAGVKVPGASVWVGRVFVVFLAVGLLMKLAFPIHLGPRNPGGRSEAVATAKQIVAALNLYQNDYGHFPEIGKPLANGKRIVCVGDPACKATSGPISLLLDVLRDIPRGPNANHALNPRQQKYFEHPKAKDSKKPRSGFADGPEFSDAIQGCLFDPWGRQYCIMFTMDDSGTVDVSAVYSDFDIVRQPAVAFSLGKDGIVGGKGYEGKYRKPKSNDPPDDAISWE